MQTLIILLFIYLGTLAIPAIYAWAFYSDTPDPYRPISIFLWVLFLTTAIDSLVTLEGTAALIFSLIDPYAKLFAALWIAKRWNVVPRFPQLYPIVAVSMMIFNIIDRLWLRQSTSLISWFDLTAAFLVMLVAIELMAFALNRGTRPLRKNTLFLFSIATLLLFFSGMVRLFLLVVYKSDTTVLVKFSAVSFVILIISNIIYLKSFTCTPSKKGYSLS